MMFALFGGDEGGKSTTPIPNVAVKCSGSPFARHLHTKSFLTDVPPGAPLALLLLVYESIEIGDVCIVWWR